MALRVTMLDLVTALAEHAETDVEIISTVIWMVNSGAVQLAGNFRGARFDVSGVARALNA